MELKSKLTLATLICAGMFTTGCQQMQQTAGASQQTASSQQTACECQPCEQAKPPAPPPAPVVKRPPPARPVAPPPVKVPQVKAKGTYKGAVQMDSATMDVMQQYQR